MSHSSTEARDTAATAATALSLDLKTTECRNKLWLKTRSDSKTSSKINRDSKMNAYSKVRTDSKANTNSKESVKSTTKSKSKENIELNAKKTEPKGKANSMTKTNSKENVDSKTKMEPKGKTDSKTKSDSGSKNETTVLNVEYGSKSDKISTKSASHTKAESANKVTSLERKDSQGSKSSTISDPKVIARLHAGSKTESIGKACGLDLQTKSDSESKPESLVNKLDLESQVESVNNVKLVDSVESGVKPASKSRSAESCKLRRKSSTDSVAPEFESGNNPESPAQTPKRSEGLKNDMKSGAKDHPRADSTDSKDSKNSKEQSAKAEENYDSEDVTDKKSKRSPLSDAGRSMVIQDEATNPNILPTKNNPLYSTTAALDNVDKHPTLKMRRDGKYYLKMKDIVVEDHPKIKRNKRGDVIPTIKKEALGVIERVVSRFCEDVLCISRAQFLPLSSQGERHLIWVGKKKANHIIRYLNGNGCYVVNRFPGDIFMKDKQVMGIILREHMLMRSNNCYWKCGVPKEDILNPKKVNEDEEKNPITFRICRHMVKAMRTDEEGCEDDSCFNFQKQTCTHLDVFIPEVQSFCTYNALQDFSNRLDDDLKGQTFICKPAYLYKGLGFRFFRTSAHFQEFYHMTEGKETSRHDFMVQRLVDRPYLFKNKKVDIRAFLLVVCLRYRRVVSFIHYGFCRVATAEYEGLEEEDEELKLEEPLTDKEMEKKQAEEYEKSMQMLVCTYKTAEERADRAKRMETQTFFEEADDRSQELTTIFESEENLQKIKEQIRHIGVRLSQAIENKVWDAFGCFQIFGLDMCADEDMKVWLIEVNSHAMSDVDTLSPTQRKVVPAVIMEALGLVVETTYKSFHHLRLRKSPTNEFEETGFLFRQNYDFIFSTLAKKRMDYVWPKPPKKLNLPFFERIGQVDEQIKNVEKRKKACLSMKIAVREEQLAVKRKRNAKDEEES